MTYLNDNLIRQPCPVCGQTENSKWGSKNGYDLARCNSCALIFVHPMPAETGAIYSEAYFSGGEEHGYVDYDRDKEPMRDTFEIYLKKMEKTLGKKGKLLDVGSATGYFMDIARGRGWEVGGVEISEHAAKIGRAKGLNIQTGTLEDTDLPEEGFDAITFLDVIEHMQKPKSALLQAKRLLKDGGIIVVNTPDAGSLWARVLGSRWQLVVPPEHLVLFNRENFADLLKESGFTSLKFANIGKYFTLPYIFQSLFHWQGFSLWNALARMSNRGFLSHLKIPINLHDNFFVIAKKL